MMQDDDDNDDPMILNNRAKKSHVGAYHRPLDSHFLNFTAIMAHKALNYLTFYSPFQLPIILRWKTPCHVEARK